MSASVKIEGVDEAIAVYKAADKNLKRIVKKALRESVKPTLADLKAGTKNSAARALLKAKIKSNKEGAYAMFGFFGKKGDPNFAWFLTYWSNYGTLTHRYPGHDFLYPIKKDTKKRRNDAGQKYELYFDTTVRANEGQMMEKFQSSVERQNNEMYKK